MNLGDDYRGHLDAAHGIKKNFNYFMQQVSPSILPSNCNVANVFRSFDQFSSQAVNEKIRRKTGKKPEVFDVVDVDSKGDDGKDDDAEMDSDDEDETTLSEERAENDGDQGMSKVSESLKRLLANYIFSSIWTNTFCNLYKYIL